MPTKTSRSATLEIIAAITDAWIVAQRQGDDPALQQRHVHGAAQAVRGEGAQRRRDDDGDGRADRQMHPHRLRHVEIAEHLVKHRHEDGAAADAEYPGQQAGDDPGCRERQSEEDEVGDGRHGFSGSSSKQRRGSSIFDPAQRNCHETVTRFNHCVHQVEGNAPALRAGRRSPAPAAACSPTLGELSAAQPPASSAEARMHLRRSPRC
jgi:hypothetical protein